MASAVGMTNALVLRLASVSRARGAVIKVNGCHRIDLWAFGFGYCIVCAGMRLSRNCALACD